MSEQDDADLDADVIEQAPRQFSFPGIPGLASLRGVAGTRRRWLVVIAAASALLVTAAALVTVRLAAGVRAGRARAGLIREITTVPVGKSVPGLPGLSASGSDASAYSSALLAGGSPRLAARRSPAAASPRFSTSPPSTAPTARWKTGR